MQTKANSFYQKLKAPHYGRIINRYFTKPLEQAHENNKVLAITECHIYEYSYIKIQLFYSLYRMSRVDLIHNQI